MWWDGGPCPFPIPRLHLVSVGVFSLPVRTCGIPDASVSSGSRALLRTRLVWNGSPRFTCCSLLRGRCTEYRATSCRIKARSIPVSRRWSRNSAPHVTVHGAPNVIRGTHVGGRGQKHALTDARGPQHRSGKSHSLRSQGHGHARNLGLFLPSLPGLETSPRVSHPTSSP